MFTTLEKTVLSMICPLKNRSIYEKMAPKFFVPRVFILVGFFKVEEFSYFFLPFLQWKFIAFPHVPLLQLLHYFTVTCGNLGLEVLAQIMSVLSVLFFLFLYIVFSQFSLRSYMLNLSAWQSSLNYLLLYKVVLLVFFKKIIFLILKRGQAALYQ